MDPGRVDEFWLLFIFLKLLSLEFACISHRRMRGWIHCNASTSAEASLKKRCQRAGIKGGSSHSGRRTFAGKVLAITGDMEALDVDQATLEAMFAEAL